MAYYCIPSSNQNYLCREVDDQINAHVRAVQVNPDLLPVIRKAYLADISRFARDGAHERKVLETRRKKLDEKELNLWRAFTELGMNANFYEALSKEYQEERKQLDTLIAKLDSEDSTHLIDLDAALNLVAQIGDRFPRCTPEQQRAIPL